MRRDFTLLHTDIVDSTAVNSRLGDAGMTPLWNRHDQLSRELVRRHEGREVDRSDGFMLLFEHTAAAAAFALDYHRMLATLPVPLRARAGIHVGPLTLRENGPDEIALGAKPLEVVGIAKAFSARLMALAQGGQTLVSPSARDALAQADEPPWRMVSHGHWRLKGIEGVLEVFELGEPGAPFMPPPDSEKSQRVVQVGGEWIGVRDVPLNLPAERDSFVGRRHELGSVALQLGEGARLLTVTGPGGMGKTRLALRYAWAWLGDYPGGVWFCDLAAARDGDALALAVAQGLQVPLGNDPVAQLGHAIAGRGRCLVILDNFEQLRRHARDTVGRWLDAARQARFLVTSREVLGLPGEHTLSLEPLVVDDAVALFHQRASAAHSAHDPGQADGEATRRLVEMLDRMPLAIELAAPRVRVMSPPELLARMGDRFRLLSGEGRPDRQATLHATLAWSWDLLSLHERSLLAQLSVFETSFGWTGVQAVVRLDDGPDAPWMLDVLQSLVQKSLVTPQFGARFSLLASVREFATAQLATEGAFSGSGPALALATRRRHGRHYARFGEEALIATQFIDLDNVVAACRQAIADAAVDDALAALDLTLAALKQTGPVKAGLELATQVRALPGLTPLQGALADRAAASAALVIGQTDTARRLAERALAALGDDEGDPALRASLAITLGEVALAAGALDEAEQRFGAAAALADASGRVHERCNARNSLGALAQRRNQLAKARGHYEAALSIAFAAGDERWQSGLLNNLASLHWAEGRPEESRRAFEQTLSLSVSSRLRRWEGNARCNLGLLHLEQGRLAEAETELTQALALARRLGYARLAHTAACNLGLVAEARGDGAQAVRHHAEAVEGADAAGERLSAAHYLGYLAAAQVAVGALSEAAASLEQGRQQLGTAPAPVPRGLLLCAEIELWVAQGRLDEARDAQVRLRALLGDAGSVDAELQQRARRAEAALTQRLSRC